MSHLVTERREKQEDDDSLDDEDIMEDSFDIRVRERSERRGGRSGLRDEMGDHDLEDPDHMSFASSLSQSLIMAGKRVSEGTKNVLQAQSSIPNYYNQSAYSKNARKKMLSRQRKINTVKQPELYTAHSIDVPRYRGSPASIPLSPAKEWKDGGDGGYGPAAPQYSYDRDAVEDDEDLIDDDEETPIHSVVKGSSNFTQSLFNAVNVLMGIGLLSFPYAMRVTGLIPGLIISTMCALITNYTAKILGHCLDSRPGLNTYSDIGDAAFGNKGRIFIANIFFFELIVACIALVILAGDTLAFLLPLNKKVLKICVFAIVLPMTYFKNLSYLAFFSFFGVVATGLLIVVLILIGLGCLSDDAPGSGDLTHPEDIQLIAQPIISLPLSFGLIMSGYAGHSVFPSIYREMATPAQYPMLVDVSYITVVICYTVTMVVGYLMFGLDVESEVQLNLVTGTTIGVTHVVIAILLWLIAIIPMTKYALLANPVSLTLENLAFKDTPSRNLSTKQEFMRLGIRTGVSLLVLAVAIFYPDFESVMAFLGAFFSFTVSVLFPIACALKLFGDVSAPAHTPASSVQTTTDNVAYLPEKTSEKEFQPSKFYFTPFTKMLNKVLLGFSFMLALTGTIWALLSGIGIWVTIPSYPTLAPIPSPSPFPF